MSFADAVRIGFQKYANFSGRASLPEYWWWVLFSFGTIFITAMIDENLGAVALLALFLPNLAVTVRRLHDTGKTGWFLLLNLIPFIGGLIIFVFLLQAGSPGPNQYGAPSGTSATAAAHTHEPPSADTPPSA